MTNLEKIALVIGGIEAIGMFMLGAAFKKAVDEHCKEKYDCQNSEEYLVKCENGEIKFKSLFKIF